jgi:Zn finger protein HypA/HybF involved in hydrogenase expression
MKLNNGVLPVVPTRCKRCQGAVVTMRQIDESTAVYTCETCGSRESRVKGRDGVTVEDLDPADRRRLLVE